MKTRSTAIYPAPGTNVSLCTVCWETFQAVSNFDKHRRAEGGPRAAKECLDPSSIGLKLNTHGLWVGDSPDDMSFRGSA